MRARADTIGARLQVGPRLDAPGTEIALLLPRDPREPRDRFGA